MERSGSPPQRRGARPGAKKRRDAKRGSPSGEPEAARPWTEAGLKWAASRYLQRFVASEARLRRTLERRLKNPRRIPPEPEVQRQWIDEIVARAKASGLIDDQRYGEGLWESYTRRGLGRRQIVQKLREKGIPRELIESLQAAAVAAAEESDVDPELLAARRYAAQKRLGGYGEPSADPQTRRRQRARDLARLARRGFSFATASAALRGPEDTD